jgi:bifunctional polynucleotide phosphatase/kinase
MFDYDWTLVKPKSGGTFPKDIDDWVWLRENVPEVIKKYYQQGFGIYIFTNQSKEWKKTQIQKALETLDIPLTI